MPGQDGTGPLGTGPIGWGLGPCGRGLAFRRGFGKGFAWRARVPIQVKAITEKEEKELLKEELKELEEERKEIEKRLKELK